MEDFTKEELLKMINNRDLKIVQVSTVQQKGFGQPYMIAEDELEFEETIKLFGLTVLSQEYMILSDEEIKHINKEGYLRWIFIDIDKCLQSPNTIMELRDLLKEYNKEIILLKQQLKKV